MRKKLLVVNIVVIILIISNATATNLSKVNKEKVDEDFNEKIEELMKKAHAPSLVACIVKNNTMVWSNAYGKYKYYRNKIASKDVIYAIGCITKSFTSTAIMQLNESGLIGLDDNVSEYLDFDLKNPKYPDINITFRMLLAHQSSLAKPGKRLNLIFYWLRKPIEKIGEYFTEGGRYYRKNVWNDYPPGQGACYSSPGYDLLGYIIENITGQTLEDYYQDNIFKPLEMMNTSFYFSSFNKNRICGLYSWIANIYIPWPIIDYSLPAPCGIKTTVLDLSHFLIMHTNGGVYNGTRVLNEKSVEEMHRIQYPDFYDDDVQYGFGWYYLPPFKGEISKNNYNFKYSGHGGVHLCSWAVMKLRFSDNVGIIILSNQGPSSPFNIVYSDERDARREIQLALFKKADEL
jgi:CubicO group peptidase (beta-lactamase class C family)